MDLVGNCPTESQGGAKGAWIGEGRSGDKNGIAIGEEGNGGRKSELPAIANGSRERKL